MRANRRLNGYPLPAMADDTSKKPGLKQRIKREMQEYLVIAAYLAAFLLSLTTYRRLILAEYHVDYFNYGWALMESLILAKVILIGQALHVGEGFRNRPLIVATLWQTFVFSLLVAAFVLAEHTVSALIHHRPIAEEFQSHRHPGLRAPRARPAHAGGLRPVLRLPANLRRARGGKALRALLPAAGRGRHRRSPIGRVPSGPRRERREVQLPEEGPPARVGVQPAEERIGSQERQGVERRPLDACTLQLREGLVGHPAPRLEPRHREGRRSSERGLEGAHGLLRFGRVAERVLGERREEEPVVVFGPRGRPFHHPVRVAVWAAARPDAYDRLFYTALAEHALGHPAESEKAVRAFETTFGAAASFAVARIQAWRGKADEAFAHLERARVEGTALDALPFLASDPLFRGVHPDPRWGPFLGKLNLAPLPPGP